MLTATFASTTKHADTVAKLPDGHGDGDNQTGIRNRCQDGRGTTASNHATPTKAVNRYPPLIVEVLPDWPTHFWELKKLLDHAPNGRPFGKGVCFIPKSDQEFRVIRRYLMQLESAIGISRFCYSLPAKRRLKVAIRGLLASTDPALVEQELRELGLTPEHVRAPRQTKLPYVRATAADRGHHPGQLRDARASLYARDYYRGLAGQEGARSMPPMPTLPALFPSCCH